MRRRLYLLPLLLLLLGCSRTPRPAAPRAPTGSAADAFPVTVTDVQKVAVTVPRRPQRIASLSPTVTEILFAIGAGKQVVAVTDQCNYPPRWRACPRWASGGSRARSARWRGSLTW